MQASEKPSHNQTHAVQQTTLLFDRLVGARLSDAGAALFRRRF
jgi:hypothetical protein